MSADPKNPERPYMHWTQKRAMALSPVRKQILDRVYARERYWREIRARVAEDCVLNPKRWYIELTYATGGRVVSLDLGVMFRHSQKGSFYNILRRYQRWSIKTGQFKARLVSDIGT